MTFRGYSIGALVLAFATTAPVVARAADAEAAVDPHAHHHVATLSATTRTTANYEIPDVKLVRQDGTSVKLGDELNDGRPVVLAFIYTSCTSVCPLISHTLSQLQTKLGDNSSRVHLVSITIDPEQDDPARLREYASTYHAGPEWQHYTGTLAASQTVQKAFDVYRGSKMDHSPAMLVRRAPGAEWARLEGFATADELLAELPDLSDLRAAR